MMRARLGIDKNKSWADWAEEEEEAAEPTKTLEGVRLRGGAVESESGHESGGESGGEGGGEGEGGGPSHRRRRAPAPSIQRADALPTPP